MVAIGMAALLTLLPGTVACQEGEKPALKLEMSIDQLEPVIGDTVQAEVKLTNTGEKDLEICSLVHEERALAFKMDFEIGGDKKKSFVYASMRPEPHVAGRLPLPKVVLKPKKSLVGLFRIPTLRTGPVTITAQYAGAGATVTSEQIGVKVKPRKDGSSRLAAFVETSMGIMQVDLTPEAAPNTVAHFVDLARRGFYDNLTFFRVVKGFVLQSGCPYDLGYGGPGYALASEAKGQEARHDKGTVAMSGNMKEGYTGSMFFISLARIPSHDGKYTIIGKVAKTGMDTVDKIAGVNVDKDTERPHEDVFIKSVKIDVVK